ncbi:MAG: hypothetical protein U1E53_07335 [Dongiaceae bacterium]
MHSVRSLIALTTAILAFGVMVQAASAADKMKPLNISKECSQYTGGTPSFCTITESSLDLIPAGTKVLYYGPVTGSPLFTSSSAVLAIGPGNSAVGYCIVYDTASPPVGTCAFHAGSGTLAGFQAILKVTVDDKQVWHWDGGYLLLPPS